MSKKVHILFAARMVREKGVLVLTEAAERLCADYAEKADFWLCGGLSGNPNAITREELESRCDGEYLQWLGHRSDMRQLLQRCHIVAFPSWYREGVPKSLIEACAVGRPIVTTNSIGCRDTVEEGVNGYLVPPRDSEALADRLRRLIDDADLRRRMGAASRRLAERDFSIKNVVETHLRVYQMVGAPTIPVS